MKKKLLSILVAVTLIATTIEMNSVTAFAEDSTGKATVEGSAQSEDPTHPTNGMVVTGDDDNDDATKETTDKTGETDITVYAKISGADGDDIIYNIEVTWGAMHFVYDWGGSWNPVTHTYNTSAEGNKVDAGWITDGYVDGTNNIITVTNHSNYPITSAFEYNAVTGAAFNATPTAANSVTGIFADNNSTLADNINEEAYNGVGATAAEAAKTASFNLDTLDTTCTVMSNDVDRTGKNTSSMYFSLCGTPDSGAKIDTFQEVGKITVTITPYTAP